MKIIQLKPVKRIYANNGQHAEYVARYTLTGAIAYADNKTATTCADVLDIQIKSARATACKGRDIRAHVAQDKARRYGYVTKDFTTMYVMSAEEWVEMVETFGTLDKDSTGTRSCGSMVSMSGNKRHGQKGGSNGGGEKIRLKHESKAMIEWLEGRA